MTDFGLLVRLIFFVALFALIGSVITFLIYKVTKKWWVKYTPALIPLIVSLFSVVSLIVGPSEGFKDLATFLVAILFMPSFIAIIITGVVLDYKDKKTKAKSEKEEDDK